MNKETNIKLPENLPSGIWDTYGATIQRLADKLGVTQLHHIGLLANKPHPQATFVPSTCCWVGPVDDGLETLYFDSEEKSRPYSKPHYCFAVKETESILKQGYQVDSQVNGPLGPATFITVDGETVELLIPID